MAIAATPFHPSGSRASCNTAAGAPPPSLSLTMAVTTESLRREKRKPQQGELAAGLPRSLVTLKGSNPLAQGDALGYVVRCKLQP